MAAATLADSAVSALGTLAEGVIGWGGPSGRLQLDLAGIEIDWWIGADDGWVGAAATAAANGADGEAHADATMNKVDSEAAVHTVRPGVAPAIESRVRVPSGEMVLRTYAVAQAGVPLVVADLENASPAAAVVAWVVRAGPGYRIGKVALDGTTLLIDERARIELPRVPLRWAVEPAPGGVRECVIDGRAAGGAFEPVTTRGDLEIAILFPVAHRTRTRIAACAAVVPATSGRVAVAQLPALDDVERGWVAALDRRANVELPDEVMQATADAARATLLLGVAGNREPERVVAAESVAWGMAPGRLPRRGSGDSGDPWPLLKATAGASGSSPRHAAEWLRALRATLVRENRDGVELLPHFPHEWLGRPVAVHDLVSKQGRVSFALRWHGARPALLWEVPSGAAVRAPGLDPAWVGSEAAGEALLAEIDPTRLLPLRSTAGSNEGVIVDEPGSFT